jgi:SAM-dependent methyltransferase
MTAPATILHFERAAPSYARLRRTWPLALLQDDEERAVHSLATVPAGAHVLDAGCGAGQTMTWLQSRGVAPIGVDRARAMAHECRCRGFAVSVQDMEALAFATAFDWVLCIGALEFTTHPLAALRSFAASLRPRGKLVLLFPRRNGLGLLYALYHRQHGTPIHLFSRTGMHRLLSEAGFQPEAWRHSPLAIICRAQRLP